VEPLLLVVGVCAGDCRGVLVVLEDWLVVVPALLFVCWVVVVALDEALAAEVCPEKPCAATADTAPVAATAPAISHRLMRRTSESPALRLATARGAGAERPGVAGLRSIAPSIVRRL
jgi:hypothetical protein